MNATELPVFVNAHVVEQAYRRAREAQKAGRIAYAEKGLRAARARDPKLLVVLERGSNILHAIAEDQQGRTRRDPSALPGEKAEPTELGLWRHAYTLVDKGETGTVLHPFMWILGAAAEVAGL